MPDIGSIGYAVRVSKQGKGYGKQSFAWGWRLPSSMEWTKYCLTIIDENKASIRVCEALGGVWGGHRRRYNDAGVHHLLRRYWIVL